MTVKQVENVSRKTAVSAHREGGLQQVLACQAREQLNSIEEIRLADSIGPGNAGEWPEANIHIPQALESPDLQTSQHNTRTPRLNMSLAGFLACSAGPFVDEGSVGQHDGGCPPVLTSP